MQLDSRGNSAGKRFAMAPNSEMNDSIDPLKKDNWVIRDDK